MGSGRTKDEAGLLAECSRAEEEDHDKRMREADFCTVDCSIAGAFDDGKDVMVLGVEDDALNCSLEAIESGERHFGGGLVWFVVVVASLGNARRSRVDDGSCDSGSRSW